MKAAATADTQWIGDYVDADKTYVEGWAPLEMAHRYITGTADPTAQIDQLQDDRDDAESGIGGFDDVRQGTIDQKNATRVATIATAQVDLATALGNAAVARAQQYGAATTSWADAVATADVTLANSTASANVTAVGASSAATAQYEQAFDSAIQFSDKISGTAAISYQIEVGDFYVIRATSRAGDDATFQSAVFDAQAVSSSALSNSALQFEDRASTAYAAWIDAMGPHYVTYGTAIARAEADYEDAVTVAATQNVQTSSTTPDDSTDLATASAAFTKQDANLKAAELCRWRRPTRTTCWPRPRPPRPWLSPRPRIKRPTRSASAQQTPRTTRRPASRRVTRRPIITTASRWPKPIRIGATECWTPNTTLPWARPRHRSHS